MACSAKYVTINLYETEPLRHITGPTIRPGGMMLTRRALDFCCLPPRVNVLDVGCGAGATVSYLCNVEGLKAFGLDLSWALLAEESKQTLRTGRVQGRAEVLPISSECLAAVFCECVMSLLSDPLAALNEWYRVLAPGGYLVASDLYARSCQGEEKEFPHRPHCCLDGAVAHDTLMDRMSAAGFDVLFFEDHTALLKQLAAQLVWQHGSLDAFWSAVGGAGCGCAAEEFQNRPGYYLMVARKGEI